MHTGAGDHCPPFYAPGQTLRFVCNVEGGQPAVLTQHLEAEGYVIFSYTRHHCLNILRWEVA